MAMTKLLPDESIIVSNQSGQIKHRERFGFRFGDRGTHSSRTIMLEELQKLLASSSCDAGVSEFRSLVVGENILGKPTATTREHTVRKLKALYGLDPKITIFRVLRKFWSISTESQPLMAMMCAQARDPLLRITAPVVLSTEIGQKISRPDFERVLIKPAPERFTQRTLEATASNLLSSFTQSGHLTGKVVKIRSRAQATAVSSAFAFFLAYLDGYRAQRILLSQWAQLLDATPDTLVELAMAASSRGLLDYRQLGNVIDFRFDDLLTSEEKEWISEQQN